MQLALDHIEALRGGTRRLADPGHWVVLPLRGRLRLRSDSRSRLLARGELLLVPGDPGLAVDAAPGALVLVGHRGCAEQLPADAALWLGSGLHADRRLALEALAWLRGRREQLPGAGRRCADWAARCPGRGERHRYWRLRLLVAARRQLQLGDDGLDQAASRAALSRFHFSRVFRRVFGMSPSELRCEAQLRDGLNRMAHSAPVWTAAAQAGFSRSSSFARAVRRHFGTNPRALRPATAAPA